MKRGEHDIEREGRIGELLASITWEGFIPQKARRRVERLRRHRFAGISLLAEELLQEDELRRQISAARRNRELETLIKLQRACDQWLAGRMERLGHDLALRLD